VGLLEDQDELLQRRPDRRRPDGEEGAVVEHVHEQIAQRIDESRYAAVYAAEKHVRRRLDVLSRPALLALGLGRNGSGVFPAPARKGNSAILTQMTKSAKNDAQSA